MYFGYKSLRRCVMCKYSPAVCRTSFHALTGVFRRVNDLSLDEMRFTMFSFFGMCFWCQSKLFTQPTVPKSALCIFSKSFVFYISVRDPL